MGIIINTSLTTGIVPRDLKSAIIKPLLKKPSLDKNLLKNYRPVSNLPFLSKILENSFSTNFSPISKKTISATPFSLPTEQDTAQRLFCYVLQMIFSSLWTMTTFLFFFCWIFLQLTTDRQILLSSLNFALGIQSTALQWFPSYFSDRYQSTSVNIRLRHHHSSSTVYLRAQYWGPFSSSCTLLLSPIS